MQATPDCPTELGKAVHALMGLSPEGPIGSPVSQANQRQAHIDRALHEVGTAAEKRRTGTTAVEKGATSIDEATESNRTLMQSQQLLATYMASVNANCQSSSLAYGGNDHQLIATLTAPLMVQMAELRSEVAESRRERRKYA